MENELPYGRTRHGFRLALFASTTVLRQGMGNAKLQHNRDLLDLALHKGSCTEFPRNSVMKLRSSVGRYCKFRVEVDASCINFYVVTEEVPGRISGYIQIFAVLGLYPLWGLISNLKFNLENEGKKTA